MAIHPLHTAHTPDLPEELQRRGENFGAITSGSAEQSPAHVKLHILISGGKDVNLIQKQD